MKMTHRRNCKHKCLYTHTYPFTRAGFYTNTRAHTHTHKQTHAQILTHGRAHTRARLRTTFFAQCVEWPPQSVAFRRGQLADTSLSSCTVEVFPKVHHRLRQWCG